MPRIELVHAVKAPPARLFEVLTNPLNLPRWEPGALEATLVSPLPLTQGGLFLVRRRTNFGDRLENSEVTEIRQHGHEWRFAYRTLVPDGTYRRDIRYDVHEDWQNVSRIFVIWDWEEMDGVTGDEERDLRQQILDAMLKLEELAIA